MRQAVRDTLIAFMAATAQAQAEATKSAQRAGIDHSAERSSTHTWDANRPMTGLRDRIRLALDNARPPSLSVVAKADGLSKQTVFKLKQDPQAAFAGWWRGGVTAESACALRRYASILRRLFLSLCLSILNLKPCQTRFEKAV